VGIILKAGGGKMPLAEVFYMSDNFFGENSPLTGDDPLLDFPGQEDKSQNGALRQDANDIESFWERISQAGLLEPVLRVGTILLSILLVLIVVWAMRTYLAGFPIQEISRRDGSVQAAPLPTPTPTYKSPGLPPFKIEGFNEGGIFRLAHLHTSIPTRPRVHVITYTVELGDSVFGIADLFGLKPETIMWANTNILQDNPHRLQVGQVINIMPTNGTYHKWRAGEDLQKVVEFYGVDVMKVIDWPGNPFDIFDTDIENPAITPGTMLIIPDGQREMIDYGPPRIPRDNPAIARTYGPGHCGVLMDGIVGDGIFMWPTGEHWLSGYDYSPETNHNGIDIAGDTGNPIWATDDGVVVYSGWSNSGYGNLVVIDHGNGWQSLYAHMDSVFVGCGESVFQGATIATMGTTGNTSGSHLHFEIVYGSAKVNPWNFLP
jgi:murein DD-endopeptidase MepM/ murein hydrolase activator NlpD